MQQPPVGNSVFWPELIQEEVNLVGTPAIDAKRALDVLVVVHGGYCAGLRLDRIIFDDIMFRRRGFFLIGCPILFPFKLFSLFLGAGGNPL
jgi:hypothetical protein